MLITQGRYANLAAEGLIRLFVGRETSGDKANLTAAGLRNVALSGNSPWRSYGTNSFECELRPSSEFQNVLSGEELRRGAATVPDGGVLDVFVQKLVTSNPWRRRATINVVPIQDGKNKIIAWCDDESQEGYIRAENDAVQTAATDPKFSRAVHSPKNYSSKRIRVPLELLDDQPKVLGLVFEAQARRIARIENRTITDEALLHLPTVAAASASALSGDDISNVLGAVADALQDSPAFGIMAHPTILRTIYKMKSGSGDYILRWPSALPFDAKFVLKNPHMPSTIASGVTSIIAGDFSALSLVDHQTVREIIYSESPGTLENNCVDLEAQFRSGFSWLFDKASATAGPLYRLVH